MAPADNAQQPLEQEDKEKEEEEVDLFEASGELKIFGTPGIVDGNDPKGAESDRSVSELEDGQTMMDKWNNHEYLEYMEQLKKRHGAGKF